MSDAASGLTSSDAPTEREREWERAVTEHRWYLIDLTIKHLLYNVYITLLMSASLFALTWILWEELLAFHVVSEWQKQVRVLSWLVCLASPLLTFYLWQREAVPLWRARNMIARLDDPAHPLTDSEMSRLDNDVGRILRRESQRFTATKARREARTRRPVPVNAPTVRQR